MRKERVSVKVADALEDRLTARLNRMQNKLEQALQPRGMEIPVAGIEGLIIENKRHRKQQLKLYSHQRKIVGVVNECIREKKPVRIICLKPRQGYGTTTFSALTYWLVSRYSLNATIMGHNDGSSQNVLNKMETFYRHDPYFLRGEITPDRNNRRLIRFPGGSEINIRTAGGKEASTGTTNQIFLFTEMAKYPANTVGAQMRGALNTVSEVDPMTFIFIESTGEPGTEYQRMWEEACRGESSFIPIFVPWNEIEEYQMPLPGGTDRDKYVDEYGDDEERLASEYELSPEQVCWRRHMIRNKARGSTDEQKLIDFMSEYPICASDAFSVSEASLFPALRLMEMLEQSSTSGFTGEILVHNKEKVAWGQLWKEEHAEIREKYLKELQFGRFKIWEHPEEYVQYVIGCDVSEGLMVGGGDRDDSAFVVRRRDNGRVVARWVGKIPPEDLGDLLHCVGLYYNTCYIVVEANNHGHTTLVRLVEQYPQYAIYRQRVGVDGIYSERYGFLTTGRSKKPLLDQLSYAIRENKFFSPCAVITQELISCRLNERGLAETNGKDLTMACALSEEARVTSPDFNAKVEVVGKTLSQQWDDWKRDMKNGICRGWDPVAPKESGVMVHG